MFSVVIICVVVFIVLKNMKKQNGQTGKPQDNAAGGNTAGPNYRGYRETARSARSRTGEIAAASVYGTPKKSNAVSGKEKRVYATASAAASVKEDVSDGTLPEGRKEKSTTEYLNEKARQDQREHAAEKLQEKERVDKKYGNRPVGGRYLPGDPIPRGMKIVYCRYCGAENIVSMDYHSDRNCYFCRTRL